MKKRDPTLSDIEPRKAPPLQHFPDRVCMDMGATTGPWGFSGIQRHDGNEVRQVRF